MTRQPAQHDTRAAFTLLEVLLALAVFAAMSTLGAMLYVQAMEVGAASPARERTTRLARVASLAQDQWDDRRPVSFTGTKSDTPADADQPARASAARDPGAAQTRSPDNPDADASSAPGAAAQFTPDAVSFYTAEPVLFPGWPLVRVAYRIERTNQPTPGGGLYKQLVYTEQRVMGFDAPPTTNPQTTPDGRPTRGRLVLLDRCEQLAFQRFGPAIPRPAPPRADAESTNPQDPRSPDERERRWRPFDEPYPGEVRAVRLLGTTAKEPFTCVFAAAPSR